MLEYQAGITDEVDYLMTVRGMEKQVAIDLVKEMRDRKPQPASAPDIFGGGA
jgi:hypothetical protein